MLVKKPINIEFGQKECKEQKEQEIAMQKLLIKTLVKRKCIISYKKKDNKVFN
jgi:hypothetical protein